MSSTPALHPAAVLLVAICGPTLLAFNEPPSPTALNQAAAVGGWALLLTATAVGSSPRQMAAQRSWAVQLATLLVGACALLSSSLAALPWALGLSGAAVAAGRHARTPVVTANVDQIDFCRPVRVGGVLVLFASVNYAGRTSMEVGVKVFSEDRASGQRSHVASAHLTFVSLDPDTGQPRPVPAIVAETPEEKRRYAAAKARRDARLARRAT